jgi:ubiquinone/menaquinone biosynthesis C-methylase UbiE
MLRADGKDAVGREFARLASRYDRRWWFYVDASIRETLKRMEVRAHERVLDVGCGTGALLAALAERAPEAGLSGIDLSPEMLKVARLRLGERAELHQARAERLPFADNGFDLVVSTSVLHYLADASAALLEMRRVLKPGGRLVITDWCHDYLACRLYGMASKLLRRAPVRIYGTEECATLIAGAGFARVRVERYKIDWLWGLMTASAEKEFG